jgi:HK97 family phage portal protein
MSIRTRVAHWLAGEQRSLDPTPTSWDLLAAHRGGVGMDAASGEVVTPASAEHALATATACVNAISSAIASLPVWVYRRVDGGRQLDERHPLMKLVHEGPNDFQTWPDFLELTVASALLRGNAIAHVLTDGAGRLEGLRPIPWNVTSIVQLGRDRIGYDVSNPRTGRTQRLLAGEVFHLKDRHGDDETYGISRIQRAAGAFGAQQALARFTGSMWRNGVHPSGVVQAEGKVTAEQASHLSDGFRHAFSGPSNSAKAMILDQGLKWQSLSVSPEDAELLASRRFSVEEIARIYGCPPPIIGDYTHNTFTNAETAGRWFATFTLGPWVRKLESEIARSVFTERERQTHVIEFDMSALLRGDPGERWASHKIAVENGILSVDEIREIEGFDPLPASRPVAA